jgi:virulence factor
LVRFGLVGVNTSHAGVFARIFNGTAETPPALEGGMVVAVWEDPSAEARALGEARALPDARDLAAAHEIQTVVTDPSALIGRIDAALVVDDTGLGAAHGRLARPFVEAGIPTFIDKPMTLDIHEAVALFDLADQRGVPLMSSSALRYAREVADLKERLVGLGTLSSAVSIGPGDWYNYGIHAVEMYQTVVGAGARWVHRFASDARDIAVVGYDDGPAVVVETLRDARYIFHLVVYGANGWTECEVIDANGFYARMMAAVLETVHTGRAPVSRAETLEVLAVLHAGERSAATRERVALADVLPER